MTPDEQAISQMKRDEKLLLLALAANELTSCLPWRCVAAAFVHPKRADKLVWKWQKRGWWDDGWLTTKGACACAQIDEG